MAETTDSLVDFQNEPASIAQARAAYDQTRSQISSEIDRISSAPIEIDIQALEQKTGAVTAELNSYFNQYKARAIESATQTVKKAAADVDVFLGKSGGGARALVAAGIKGDLMQKTYNAIGDLYQKHADSIASTTMAGITTTLEGQKANIQAQAVKADSIASLLKIGTDMFSSVTNAIENNYEARLSAAVEFAKVRAEEEGNRLAEQKYNLDAAVSLLSDPQYGIANYMRYGLPVIGGDISTKAYKTEYKSGGLGMSIIQRV